jgi:trimethylamine--corrinoid protein Co-methyltransferase
METNYHAQQTPQFRVLSDRQIEQVYQATLLCLRRTGVNLYNAEARDLLEAAGAEVDGLRVRIPPHLVRDALAAAPPAFTLWGRDGIPRMWVAPDHVYFGPGPTCTYFFDPESGQRRRARRGDPGLVARVCDALPNIDYVMGLALIGDVPPQLAPVFEFAEIVTNTVKPVLAWAYSVDQVEAIYRIALAVADDDDALRQRPFWALFSTYQSPLVLPDHDVANVLWAAERGVPLILTGGGTAGATAPITGAGLLVTYLAGGLAELVAVQLKRRGAPVCLGGVPQAMDLRSGRCAYGSPEMSLYGAAMADIARYLGLPFIGTAGASEAKVLDPQAAIESTLQVAFSALSGASLVHDVGFLDCADIGSLEVLVMTDEIIAMVRRIMRGIEVSQGTLMLDLIDQVGPGGEFMSTRETARRCRDEIWTPSLMDRAPWELWERDGSPTMNDRIRAKLERVLATHHPLPLPPGAAEEIEAILQTVSADRP